MDKKQKKEGWGKGLAYRKHHYYIPNPKGGYFSICGHTMKWPEPKWVNYELSKHDQFCSDCHRLLIIRKDQEQ